MRANAATSRRAVRTQGRRVLFGTLGTLFLLLSGAWTIVLAQDQPQTPAQPAPAAKPKEDQPKKDGKAPENVEMLPSSDAASMLGKQVKGPNGEHLGLIVDVLVGPDGRPRAAVIDFGGFLGVGSRKIAIDWKALDFGPLRRAGTAILGLDRAQIAAAPEYKPGPPGTDVVTAPGAPAPPPVDTQK
jgi:hypothetical protein